jgi:RecA/RadA recombinase
MGYTVSEICIRAQLLKEEGGLETSIIYVDGGNVFDPYLIANLSRQHNISIGQTLQNIKVSRAFTCHQLVSLICERLPEALKTYNSRLVVISDIFSLFNDAESGEAGRMFNHITHFISELVKKENIIVIATCLRYAREPIFESYLTSRVDIILDVTENIQVTLENYNR